MRQIAFSPPDIHKEDIEEVIAVLKSGWITTGPKTKEFETEIAKYCETHCGVCLNSATAGLELILRVLGIGPGDEVITSAYTYTASASVIHHVGARPVLVDVAPNSYHIDCNKIEQAITPRTKAIITVDIGGVMCDYDRIYEVVKSVRSKFLPSSDMQEIMGRIAIIADGAHSLGAVYKGKKSGAVADFTSFSFHAVKNLTTGEGGAVTWRSRKDMDDKWMYKQFMLLALHGQTKDALAKTKLGAWEYDILEPAYKYNMTDMMAALGLSQLRRYDTILSARKRMVQLYDELIKCERVSVLEHRKEESESSFHLYMVNLLGRDENYRNKLIEEMAKNLIAVNVHYKPLPMLTAYKKMGFEIKDYPCAYEMYKSEVTLPLHTLLCDEDVFYITEVFKRLI